MPGDPFLLASFKNNYTIKRSDGSFIDAKPTGISKNIFFSSSFKNNFDDNIFLNDVTWLNHEQTNNQNKKYLFLNPLAVGHYINHNSSNNVMYFEFEFPPNFPLNLKQFIPNVYYNSNFNNLSYSVKSIALITIRDVQDEELFSDYCFVGKNE